MHAKHGFGKFEHLRNLNVWADYKKARNKAVRMFRSAKRTFYVSKPGQNVNNAKGTWTIIKEARSRLFGLGVYLLKTKFIMEEKLRFP